MKETIKNLCNYLEKREFQPIECEGMINDIIDLIHNEKHPSITDFNLELEILGWGIGVLDDELYAMTISLSGKDNINITSNIISLDSGKVMQKTSPSFYENEVA